MLILLNIEFRNNFNKRRPAFSGNLVAKSDVTYYVENNCCKGSYIAPSLSTPNIDAFLAKFQAI